MQTNWTEYFQAQLPEIIRELKQFVEMESPTHNKQAVDRLGELIKDRFHSLGCEIEMLPQQQFGNQIRATYGTGTEQILILGHFDTVKEIGTLAQEPWRIEEGKAYGPGVYDMKAGIVFSYFALKAIIQHQLPLSKKIVFFWNTDEEVGSPSSAALIAAEAKKSKLALVIEPAYGSGDLKTSRKGGGDFLLKVIGRAAHAGNDHQSGINAIEELARQIVKIQSWTNYDEGTTLSVGTIRGGKVSNVIPEHAEAEIDLRVTSAAETEKIRRWLQELAPELTGAKLEVKEGVIKPPMERTEETERLFLHAKKQARLEGIELGEIGAGGTSDGNFTAAAGTPTLDGLGPVGDGAHASHEHVVIEQIPGRIALLLRLMTTL